MSSQKDKEGTNTTFEVLWYYAYVNKFQSFSPMCFEFFFKASPKKKKKNLQREKEKHAQHNFWGCLCVCKEFSNPSPQSTTYCVNIKEKAEIGTTFEESSADWRGYITHTRNLNKSNATRYGTVNGTWIRCHLCTNHDFSRKWIMIFIIL